jgi:hypothetical protein
VPLRVFSFSGLLAKSSMVAQPASATDAAANNAIHPFLLLVLFMRCSWKSRPRGSCEYE